MRIVDRQLIVEKTVQAADYRIFVEGELDPLWFDWLGKFEIKAQRQPGQHVVTLLECHLKDQSALQDVLDTLCMLDVCLIRIERLPYA